MVSASSSGDPSSNPWTPGNATSTPPDSAPSYSAVCDHSLFFENVCVKFFDKQTMKPEGRQNGHDMRLDASPPATPGQALLGIPEDEVVQFAIYKHDRDHKGM
jgi:hypothetical protein